jgi:hypothetical protein
MAQHLHANLVVIDDRFGKDLARAARSSHLHSAVVLADGG